ncbi:MAG: zf-HC2 domain-containing protein [bacterium]
MDCREFRNNHVAFVDDLLPAVTMDAMHQHVTRCSRCSRQDTSIRRSLFLVRNLKPIEPSADFMARLNARLESLGPESRVDVVSPRPYVSSAGTFAAFAAGVAAVAYMSIETSRYFAQPNAPLTPAVASALEPTAASMANAAFVASVPTGIPVWPAVLMVGQGPMRFASMDFHDGDHAR